MATALAVDPPAPVLQEQEMGSIPCSAPVGSSSPSTWSLRLTHGTIPLLALRTHPGMLSDPSTSPRPLPLPSIFDICNGQQGTDLAVPDTCELEVSIEGDFVPPPGG